MLFLDKALVDVHQQDVGSQFSFDLLRVLRQDRVQFLRRVIRAAVRREPHVQQTVVVMMRRMKHREHVHVLHRGIQHIRYSLLEYLLLTDASGLVGRDEFRGGHPEETHGARPGDRLLRQLLHRHVHVSVHLVTRYLSAVLGHYELEDERVVGDPRQQRDHAGLLIQKESLVRRRPGEVLVRQVPVVGIVHVHPADIRFRRLAFVIVDEYRTRALRHRVIVLVADDHSQRRRTRHWRFPAVCDCDRDIVALSLLAIEFHPGEQIGVAYREFCQDLVVGGVLVDFELERGPVLLRVPVAGFQLCDPSRRLILAPHHRVRHVQERRVVVYVDQRDVHHH